MKRWIHASNEVTGKMILLRENDLGVELPDRITLTDNGARDLTKQGINGYYVWVGYRHKGSRSEANMAREVKNVAYDIIVPALVDFCQSKGIEVYEDDIVVDDYIDSLDMFRVWVSVDE